MVKVVSDASCLLGQVSRRLRLSFGISKSRLAALVGVSPREIERWESCIGEVQARHRKTLLDLRLTPPAQLMDRLRDSVARTPAPRALTCAPRLKLVAMSPPALEKRPSMANWIGRDLIAIASGVLEEMLDDRALQKAISKREVASIVATTSSVLDTPELKTIAVYRTTINCFSHDGIVYRDAISLPVSPDEPCGYTPVYVDELGRDLFGDAGEVDALLEAVTWNGAGRIPTR